MAEQFTAFVERLQPPQGKSRYWDFVAWLEGLIGSYETVGDFSQDQGRPASLNMITRIQEVGGAAAEHKGTIPSQLVQDSVLPAVLSLAEDGSFRVRRSAAQALPRARVGEVAFSELSTPHPYPGEQVLTFEIQHPGADPRTLGHPNRAQR